MNARLSFFSLGTALAVCLFGLSAEPVQANDGFFNSLREMFRTKKTRPRRRRAVVRRPVIAVPRLSFAYAHQAGRYKRYRYSHQTPYGFLGHPYRHGFAAAKLVRPKRVKRPSRAGRREYRFGPNGRVRRLF